jgi:hypothetical protein
MPFCTRLQAVLKLAAVLGAGYERTHVQSPDGLVLQSVNISTVFEWVSDSWRSDKQVQVFGMQSRPTPDHQAFPQAAFRMLALTCRASGTSLSTIRCARPSTTAVFPTPGSPIRQGLFFVRRDKIWIARLLT